MNSGITGLTSAMGLTLCLGLIFMPLGCGSSQDFTVESPRPTHDGPTAPESTVAQLTECAKQGALHLADTNYAIIFDVDVTESGTVREAKIRESLIPDRGMESCMVRALEAMSVPRSIMGMLASQPVSRQSREYLGYVGALGGAVNLIPIVIGALGVTILVAVTLHVAEEAVEAARRRLKVEKRCKELLEECLEYPQQPEWNRGTFGDRKACESCFGICKRENGQWPHDKCPRPGSRPADRWN
jgi:hypothetical protein